MSRTTPRPCPAPRARRRTPPGRGANATWRAVLTVALACGLGGACSSSRPPFPSVDAGGFGGAGGSDAGVGPTAGGASDGGLPLAQACTRLNARRCEALKRCGLIGDDTASYRDCVAFFAATWCGPTRWLPRVEAGTLRYDPVRAQACADDWVTRSCVDVTAEPQSCQRVAVAAVPLQGGCYDGYSECVEGVCRGGGCRRRCLMPGLVGDTCQSTSDCASGLLCRQGSNGSGQCATLGRDGEPCGPTMPCGPALTCLGSTCRRLPGPAEPCLSGRCDETSFCALTPNGGTCEARRDTGQGCSDDGECASTMLCDAAQQACAPRQVDTRGADCSLRQRCSAGNTCLVEPSESRGTCGAPRPEKAPCARPSDCEAHLTCLPRDGGAACSPRQEDGAPCSETRDCRLFSACTARTCAMLPSLGQPCSTERPCLWGACLDGPDGGSVCGEVQGPGQPCRSGGD